MKTVIVYYLVQMVKFDIYTSQAECSCTHAILNALRESVSPILIGARLDLPKHMLTVEPDEIMEHLDSSSVIFIRGSHLISYSESYLSTTYIQAKSPFRSD